MSYETFNGAAQKIQSAVAKLAKKREEHKASVVFEEFNDNPVDASVDIQLGKAILLLLHRNMNDLNWRRMHSAHVIF